MKSLSKISLVMMMSLAAVGCKAPSADTVAGEAGSAAAPAGDSTTPTSVEPNIKLKGSLTENEDTSGDLEILGQVENTGGAAAFVRAECALFRGGTLIATEGRYITGVVVEISGVSTSTGLNTGDTGTFKIPTDTPIADVDDIQCTFTYDPLGYSTTESDSATEGDSTAGNEIGSANNLGDAGGVWRGIFTPDDTNEPRRFYKVLIAPEAGGSIVMLSDDESSLSIQGSNMLKSTLFSQSEADVRMSFTEYEKENATDDGTDTDADGLVDDDINYGVSFDVIAQLTPKNKIEGTYARVYKKAGVNETEAGTVLFEYDPKYERGDRVNFYYTNNTFWSLDKAINSGAGRYSVAFGKGGAFSFDSMETAGLWFTYTTDAVGSSAADDAFEASETAVISAFLVGPAVSAATAAEDAATTAENVATTAENVATTAESAAEAEPADTDLAAAATEARTAATEARTAATEARTAATEASASETELKSDAERDLQLTINAINRAIATGKAAEDPGATELDDQKQPRGTEVEKALEVNIKAGNVVSALTASGESIQFVEQLINLPENATLISWRFPDDSSDTEGCNYKGNFDLVDPKYFIYNSTFDVTQVGGLVPVCGIVGEYSGLAAIEEEYQPLDHEHTHYKFMTFGLANTDETINKTINNRLTLNFFGE